MEKPELTFYPTTQQREFLLARGYGEIVEDIQVFQSRKQGANFERSYYGILQDGQRQWIAWVDGELREYNDWKKSNETSKDPVEKRIQSLELSVAKLTTQVRDQSIQLAILLQAKGRY